MRITLIEVFVIVAALAAITNKVFIELDIGGYIP